MERLAEQPASSLIVQMLFTQEVPTARSPIASESNLLINIPDLPSCLPSVRLAAAGPTSHLCTILPSPRRFPPRELPTPLLCYVSSLVVLTPVIQAVPIVREVTASCVDPVRTYSYLSG